MVVESLAELCYFFVVTVLGIGGVAVVSGCLKVIVCWTLLYSDLLLVDILKW